MIDGCFIVIEGIDGAGTTTLVARAAEALRARKLPVYTTCEPSGGPIGSLVRQALGNRFVVPGAFGPHAPGWDTMALLFAADRLDHLDAEISPALRDGVIVLSDRYDLSSLAYQTAAAGPDEAEVVAARIAWIRELNRRARRPDLTLVLDVSDEVAAKRRRARGRPSDLYEDADLQSRLAAVYAEAEKLVPGDRLVHVDANRSADEVLADSLAAIDAFR